MDELSGGKMMYVFMRVRDPNTQLYKNVLVNWVSEVLTTHLVLPCLETNYSQRSFLVEKMGSSGIFKNCSLESRMPLIRTS